MLDPLVGCSGADSCCASCCAVRMAQEAVKGLCCGLLECPLSLITYLQVTAIGRSPAKEAEAKSLGANRYITLEQAKAQVRPAWYEAIVIPYPHIVAGLLAWRQSVSKPGQWCASASFGPGPASECTRFRLGAILS